MFLDSSQLLCAPSTAFLGRDYCEFTSGISPLFFTRSWLGALPPCLSTGSQLSCICGEGGEWAEETASRVKNLNNRWRQKGQVSVMFFSYTVCVGSAWWWNVSCCATDVWNVVIHYLLCYMAWRGNWMVLNLGCWRKNLQKENVH